MDLHSENVQTGLPRSNPDAAREPATTEIIDIDYEIVDVQGQPSAVLHVNICSYFFEDIHRYAHVNI